MASLDDYYYFAQVAQHGGFSRASRQLGIPKSRLSRHVSALETRLKARLVNRTTRRFAVTEIGRQVLQHAAAMLAEAEAAREAVEFAHAEPRGLLKVSCPVALAQSALADILPVFLARHPGIRLTLHVSNRRVDLLNEGLDAALRVRQQLSGEDGLIVRSFGQMSELLVASAGYLSRHGEPRSPQELPAHAILCYGAESDRHLWQLTRGDGSTAQVEFTPRLACHKFVVLRQAALAGTGIALLPENVVRADLAGARLVRILGEWNLPQGILHLVFPSRRGMLPSLRAFIDFLAERLPETCDFSSGEPA